MLPKRYVFPRSHNNLTSCILDAAEERRLGLVPRSRKSVAVIYDDKLHISPASTPFGLRQAERASPSRAQIPARPMRQRPQQPRIASAA